MSLYAFSFGLEFSMARTVSFPMFISHILFRVRRVAGLSVDWCVPFWKHLDKSYL
jgi:hypothetical protein